MRKLVLGAALLFLAAPLAAQPPISVQSMTLLSAFDLDGEAADANQVVTVIALTDSATFTVLANPDVCRLVDATIVDADSSISAGVLSITGTDCLGTVRTGTFTFAGGGSGVESFTMTGFPSRAAYFATVTDVSTGVLTGETAVDDTVTIGYTSNSVNGWAMWGRLGSPFPGTVAGVNPNQWYEARRLITTSGANSLTLDGVTAANDPFEDVAAGDLLYITISGTTFERKVLTRASADQVTINASVNIPSAGVTFRYKKLFFSTDPWDILAIPVRGYRTVLFDWSVDANANTGGVVTSLECTFEAVDFPTARWVELDTTTVASAGTQANTSESINLELLPYAYCRFGLSFGTGDDADSAPEDINLAVTMIR